MKDQESKTVVKLPITFSQRRRNRLGKWAVPCEVSDRWLQFSEQSDYVGAGEFITMDVMTSDREDRARKLCQIILDRNEILRALSNVKPRAKVR